ncbi:MAG: NAD(+)/NADH kinase [Clostridia bacterium]|nr:NAD(+)/NADH kinase [Clostridia bacterium]
MTVGKVLIFPSPKGNVSDNNIKQVEEYLDRFGVLHERYSPDLEHDFDAVIALGGDGTMLNAARVAFRRGTPIMCINFGTLGYMSGLENSELDMLESLKLGFETEKRMLLDVKVERNGSIVAECTSLNEAVIARKADGDIAMLELRCDGALVCDYRADGIIIATPTGSSAYAMSAGGPIIDTKLDAVCVCPICPHSLGARAMVFSPNSHLEAVIMNGEERGNDLLIADGKAIAELKFGDKVSVTRSDKTLELIKLKKDAFYETLYNKMS